MSNTRQKQSQVQVAFYAYSTATGPARVISNVRQNTKCTVLHVHARVQ